MHKNKSANRNPANYRLYHALMEALIEDENVMDKEVADTVKDHKRKHDGDDDDDDDDKGPPAGSNQGKSSKKRRTRESNSAKKPSTTKESSKGNKIQGGSKMVSLAQQGSSGRAYDKETDFTSVLVGIMCISFSQNRLILVNPEGHRIVHDISIPLPLGGPPTGQKNKTSFNNIQDLKAALILNLEFEELVPVINGLKPSDHDAVRSYMQILNVISIKTYERYGYNYLREIVLRRANYNEYKISEKDFKSLYPNYFKDLNILHIQGKLDHLPKQDKLSILSLIGKQPNWDASDFPFKEDYTIVFKTRAVIYRDRDDNRKMMRIDEVHNFNKAWEIGNGSVDEKEGSEDFIEVIERRLKIRRIFRSLESFVGGRLRDIDYRLISRTE
ncbi:hypothetical protein Tco_0052914 [Tanacetum coccineum]